MVILDYLLDRISDPELAPLIIPLVGLVLLSSIILTAMHLNILAYFILGIAGTFAFVLISYAIFKNIRKDYTDYLKKKKP